MRFRREECGIVSRQAAGRGAKTCTAVVYVRSTGNAKLLAEDVKFDKSRAIRHARVRSIRLLAPPFAGATLPRLLRFRFPSL